MQLGPGQEKRLRLLFGVLGSEPFFIGFLTVLLHCAKSSFSSSQMSSDIILPQTPVYANMWLEGILLIRPYSILSTESKILCYKCNKHYDFQKLNKQSGAQKTLLPTFLGAT